MPEPQGDDADVHAGLQQMHSGCVADEVRRDAALGKLRLCRDGSLDGKRKPLGHVGARHRLAVTVGQQR